jgi:hypothetical protein
MTLICRRLDNLFKTTASSVRRVLHPFLFALFPLLFLYNANREEVRFENLFRPAAMLLLVTAIVFGLLRLAARSWQRAGLLATLVLVMFFSYGHVDRLLGSSDSTEHPPEQSLGLALLWLGLLVAGAWWLGWKVRRPERLTGLLNLVGIFLVALNGFGALQGLRSQPAGRAIWPDEGLVTYHPLVDELPQAGAVVRKPDIYYIVLDGYAQGSVLRDIYGLDNQPFYDFLEKTGFTVAQGSHANYPQTILSLTSSLNFAYLDELFQASRFQYSRAPLMPLLNDPRLVRFLRGQGYRVMALETTYESTDLRGADVFVPAPLLLNPLETQLLTTSAARLAVFELQTEIHRRAILERFRAAAGLASREGPKFVFLHLVVPHPPFVFDRDGGLVLPDDLTISDGSHYSRPGPVYAARYKEQLLYVNTLVEELLREILAGSPEPPVILLQADHGPGAYLDWDSLEKTCLRERLSILNAYYLPGVEVDIPPGLTPVNSFRLVLDAYFNTDLGPLPERNYFAIWPQPFHYHDVTDRVDTCAPLE